MELIDRDALEEKILKRWIEHYRHGGTPESEYAHEDMEILCLIDTLEVKEVNINKCPEITWNDVSLLRHIMAEYRREVSNGMLRVMDEEFCKEVLKRFKAQKGAGL